MTRQESAQRRSGGRLGQVLDLDQLDRCQEACQHADDQEGQPTEQPLLHVGAEGKVLLIVGPGLHQGEVEADEDLDEP